MMTKVLALELSTFNIQVNCIAPGFIKTKFSEAFWSNAEFANKYLENLPLRRVAEPEELVGTAIYLASEASRYVTGETIFVDGGFMI
jgi:NAD(P)-dependent dehydrogenase (short-subunit alcohol dehydrogenase family)